MTPFMQLTLINGTPCFISILQVVLVEPREYRDAKMMRAEDNKNYTYIVLAGGESFTRSVKDSYESVMDAIQCYYKNRDFVAKSLSPKI